MRSVFIASGILFCNDMTAGAQSMPKMSGILRGKYEYQTEMHASRFEIRNARLSASGKVAGSSEYKLEVDLCDESAVKMKDAWVRVNPWRTLRLTLGQQRMPFSIDAHRNPSAQYFANRSFIAKQVGDMRDVGFQVGYDFLNDESRKVLSLDAGVFNGSNLDNQKSAWFTSPGYSARIQYFPTSGLALIPSIQHQQIAERQASYTSLDFGAYYEVRGWHMEAEYLHKVYDHGAFSDCSAVDAMIIYRQKLDSDRSYVESISYLGRYDWMQDHSSGKSGFVTDANGATTSTLVLTDAQRHRLTIGTTFSLRNSHFPTDIRLNYENYWYPNGGAKESERNKLVCELMIKF
ncbi:MAG: OprO/OprP family phosphate-selective porin [Bacteroidales bacterium]|nr:OprO/OprP family phosphate-selective porin [Bacteroidales bacterium]